MDALDILSRFNEEEQKRNRQAVPPGPEDVMQQPVPRDKDPNLIGLALTGAKTTEQDVDRLMPAGFQLAGKAAADQYAYEQSSAAAMRRPGQVEELQKVLTAGGANPDMAGKLAMDATRRPEDVMQQTALQAGTLRPKVDNYGNVIGFEEVPSWKPEMVDYNNDGVPDAMMTSPNSAQWMKPPADDSKTLARDRQLAADRARTFGGTSIESGQTVDSYWKSTYDEQGRFVGGKDRNGDPVVKDPAIENWMNYLNKAYESAGYDPPFKRTADRNAPSNAGTQQAPPAAVEYLRANPETAEMFKAKYGYLPEGL